MTTLKRKYQPLPYRKLITMWLASSWLKKLLIQEIGIHHCLSFDSLRDTHLQRDYSRFWCLAASYSVWYLNGRVSQCLTWIITQMHAPLCFWDPQLRSMKDLIVIASRFRLLRILRFSDTVNSKHFDSRWCTPQHTHEVNWCLKFRSSTFILWN